MADLSGQNGSRHSVVAVVVTRDRPGPLLQVLQSLDSQGPSLAHVVVVDSGSQNGPPDLDDSRLDRTSLVVAGDNVGYGAGLALGMAEAARSWDPDFYWLLDDDSPVDEGSLSQALELLVSNEDVGVLGNRGGTIRGGVIRHRDAPTPGPWRADFCLVDGALVSRAAAASVGFPRTDFFMMHEDLEYTTRISNAGYRVLISSAVQSHPMHLGSTGPAGNNDWRLYYQSRNHLRMAIDRRSPVLISGWIRREAKIVIAAILLRRDPLTRARQVILGGTDAMRGRMGRTVEPGGLR